MTFRPCPVDSGESPGAFKHRTYMIIFMTEKSSWGSQENEDSEEEGDRATGSRVNIAEWG